MASRTLPEVLELEGNEVDEFLKYDQRVLTSEEQDSLDEADSFYNSQCTA